MKEKRILNQRGFTLIEIMVVVIILGILAGLVVPRLLEEPEKARITTAKVQMKSIGDALSQFKLDNGFFPETEQGLQALVIKPEIGRIPKKYREGGYMKSIPLDPWGTPYAYLSPGVHDDFDLISFGADGEPGGEGNDADIESWNIQ